MSSFFMLNVCCGRNNVLLFNIFVFFYLRIVRLLV